ncbi:MAG: P-type ATPase, partial [Sulfobacillus sp.]
MAVVKQNETCADLGEVAEAGIHLPEPAKALSKDHHDGHDHDDHHDHEHRFDVIEILRVAFVALAAAAVWFHLWEPFHRVSVIGLVATLVGGYPIFKEALENIVERRMTMELSMTIALFSALAIGEFFTALVITAFVLAAEILEGLTVERGRRAIQDMLDFLPQTASVLREDQIVEVDTKTILPGDIVVIRPGGRIPVDGRVLSGHSFVEQAAITGEAM